MALTIQDLTKGLDFSGLVNATGADHDQLVELSIPRDDGGGEGKGLVLVTVDSALDVPTVPDAATTTKWQRYLWIRIPHATDTDLTPNMYAWNDNEVSDPTYLKWEELLGFDVAAVLADVAAALAASANAVATANSAYSIANVASGTANAASITASAASVTAANASATAAAAQLDATNALGGAASAQSQANNALTVANANKNVANINVGASAGQMIRSNATNTALEFFLPVNNYAKFSEEKASGVDSGANLLGPNIRVFNVEVDAGNIATIASSSLITLDVGTYYIKGRFPAYNINRHQACLINNATGAVILNGSSEYSNGYTMGYNATLEGIVTLGVATVMRVDHYIDGFDARGLGRAVSFALVGGAEVYSVLEIWKIG